MGPAESNQHALDPRLEGVGSLLRAASPNASARQSSEGRARLVEAVAQMQPRGRSTARVWSFGVAAAAAVVLAVAFGAWKLRTPSPLTYAVEGSAGASASGYVIAAPGAGNATVRFSDGSEVALVAGSRARIANTTAEGGEVVLESGRAKVHVVHQGDRTRWSFDAGPYAVRVTGTGFTVAWSGEGGTLDVWMNEGRVVVSGPAAPDGVALTAGQHVRAELVTGSMAIDGANAPAADAPITDAAPTPSEAAPPAPTTTEASSPRLPPAPIDSAASTTVSWTKLVAAGKYEDVLRDAHAQGEDVVLAARPLGDLRALGDAARYRGQTALASRAYTTLRARFPSSGEARTAAFLLGRLSEEQLRSPAEAMRWYDTYLAEAPSGPFAGDALGRKMVMTSRASGPASARALAATYIAKFPSGPYASAARDLTK